MIPDLYNPCQSGPDALVAGTYLRRSRGRVDIPVRIWFGPPQDPEDRDAVLDRSWRWQIEINGGLYGDPDNPVFVGDRPLLTLDGIWPEALKYPAEQADFDEYEYRVALADHAALHDPRDAFARTGGRIDPMQCTLPGMG